MPDKAISSESESSSSSEDEFDPNGPSKYQISRFTDPNFQQDYFKFMEHTEEGKFNANLNPYTIEEYLECHRFEMQGYVFDCVKRRAKRKGRA